MLRRFHLILAAFAMLAAPMAMGMGAGLAANPASHQHKAMSGHCGDDENGREKSASATQCCTAMCSAVAPASDAAIAPAVLYPPILAGTVSTGHRAFLAELPTPPPRIA